ncbi:MAG: protein kinase [Elusimicrobiota bacterium]
MAEQRKLAAIMFTDIRGFTHVMNEREALALELLRIHNLTLDEASGRHGGVVVKSIGDSYLIDFGSAVNALRCALEAQGAFKVYNVGKADADSLLVRISLHVGDVVTAGNDFYGDGVNLASRLQGVTPPGGICISREVYSQVKGKLPCQFVNLGIKQLKGIAEAVEVFQVYPPGAGPEETASRDSEDRVLITLKPALPSPGAPAPGAPPESAWAPPPRKPEDRSAPPAAPVDPLIGRQIGPCRIEGVLGRGGMGTVYRAHHIPLDRAVAVKVMSSAWASAPGAAESFLREARLAAKLEDPRVVQIHDVGEHEALRYIIMQLVAGETLQDKVLRDGPLSQDEAHRIMKEVVFGLQAAHRKGIVHRDIKPANIMLEKEGGVKIMDFGISATSGQKTSEQSAGSSAGSFDFMAPEQGFDAPPDARMDLYSFGSTYFFTLTGVPPYMGGSGPDIMLKHRESPVPDVREVNREVTQGAAALISRLMAKDPSERPPTAESVLKAMEATGMLLNVDPSGSPFKILPAPVAPKEGFMPASQPWLPPAPAPAAPAPAIPVPPKVAVGGTWTARLIFGVFVAAVFGRHWARIATLDWAAAALAAAMVSSAFFSPDLRRSWHRALSLAAYAAMAAFLYRYGLRQSWAPRAMPGLEVLIGAGLGLACGGCALFLGLGDAKARERSLALALLWGSFLVLLGAACALPLPAEVAWTDGVPAILRLDWGVFLSSGGPWRWGGVAVVYAAWRIVRLSAPKPTASKTGAPPPVLNWNR